MLSPAQSLSLMIATGIGLHNFSEGLAIGQSAAAGEISLALMLIIGFGLHNATEGFGIVGPFAASDERPSWGFLLLVGLIGGGPTFFGTLIGQTWVSEALSVAFLALAAGSILYVVIELLDVCRRAGRSASSPGGSSSASCSASRRTSSSSPPAPDAPSADPELVDQHLPHRVVLVVADALREDVDDLRADERHPWRLVDGLAVDALPQAARGARVRRLRGLGVARSRGRCAGRRTRRRSRSRGPGTNDAHVKSTSKKPDGAG